MAFTPRQASALAASAIANRILLRPNAIIPRLLEIDGAKYCIENVVGRDILVSKMAQVVNGQSAQEDNFILSEAGCEYMFENIDRGLLMDAGVLVPE